MSSRSEPKIPLEETQAKVEEYTKFLDTVLKPEILEAKRLLEDTLNEISEYEQLRVTLEKDLPPTTTVDLGFQAVQCEAKIIENPKIFVHVGLGFHVEMTISEALKFVQQRITFLQVNPLEVRQKKYNQVQDHVQSSMNILTELERVHQKL